MSTAKGCYFYDADGKRYLDFNSQLMCVNIGHGDPRVIEAITRQAEQLAYSNSVATATEPRALLGRKLASLFPGDIEKSFFTLGGAEANTERDPYREGGYGPEQSPCSLPLVPRRDPRGHLTHRRPETLAERARHPGRRPCLDFYHGTGRPPDSAERALAQLQETIELEGPETIAAFILEPVTGPTGSSYRPMAICRESAVSWTVTESL